MSKSYKNFINIFLPEKELKKVVMSIVTDSRGVDDPKDPTTDNVFRLYELIADESQVAEMRTSYLKGGMGYGAAKTALFEVILDKYRTQRREYNRLMSEPLLLEKELATGEKKAADIADRKLLQVRSVLGYL